MALGAIAPFFIVRDVPRAVRFYQDALGFELRVLEPADTPFFAIVGRDSAQLLLKHVSEAVGPQPNPTRHEWAPWDAFVFVSDPDGLHDELSSRGVALRTPITDRDDGLRGFEVEDRDGYVLFFGCPI